VYVIFTEGQISALDLFDLPPTQTGIENIKMENIQPSQQFLMNRLYFLIFPELTGRFFPS
jgi:hypothetical protein